MYGALASLKPRLPLLICDLHESVHTLSAYVTAAIDFFPPRPSRPHPHPHPHPHSHPHRHTHARPHPHPLPSVTLCDRLGSMRLLLRMRLIL